MKKKFGYVITIIMLVFICIFLSLTVKEIKQSTSFPKLLDTKIHLNKQLISKTSYLLDNTGKVFSEIYLPTNNIPLQDKEIPSIVKDAFVISEDKHFYEHHGFDITAIGRAFVYNANQKDTEQGASTITQQLARNMMQSFEKTYNRKLRELLYAYQIEKKWSKEKILTEYVNTIYFGNNAYGMEAAALHYFSKSTQKLSNAELIFLVSIPNNPTLYNPITSFQNTKKRQERLIDLLAQKHSITQKEASIWKKEKITLTIRKKVDLYPDYATYVEDEFKELVAKEYGFQRRLKNANDQEKEKIRKELDSKVDLLLKNGVEIHTALQPTLQKAAVNSLNQTLSNIDVQGAIVAIDQNKHRITAIVGGKNYQKYNFNRSYQAFRQPGSSIKPLLVYGPYLQETHTSIYKKVSANAFCNGNYCPSNYSGKNYGMVTLETAFKYSYNTPAVRLLDHVGIKNAFSYLNKFSFQQITEKDYQLSAALGGFTNGMTLLEMTDAYTTFGNNGNYQKARAITKVTDINGKTLMKWEDSPVEVWDKTTNNSMRSLLKTTVKSGTAKSAYFPSSYLGGKTGTTNDYKDYWIIGLTNNRTVGVWIGKDQPVNLKRIENKKLHLKIWKDMLLK